MDVGRRKAMRTQHAKYAHTCVCGRVVYGNGGWASHRWACAKYQARLEERVDEWGHVPVGDINVRRYPRWSYNAVRERWVESGLS